MDVYIKTAESLIRKPEWYVSGHERGLLVDGSVMDLMMEGILPLSLNRGTLELYRKNVWSALEIVGTRMSDDQTHAIMVEAISTIANQLT